MRRLCDLRSATKLVHLHRIHAQHFGDLACDALARDRAPGLDQEDRTRRDRGSPSKLSDAQESFRPEYAQRHHQLNLMTIVAASDGALVFDT